MAHRPTMNDVARTAGVSLKTVSRVVNGETTVAADLAARVRAAVESLDYRPHLGASLLHRNDRRTRTIGVLLQDLTNPFSAAVHRAVEDQARARGIHVLTGSLDEDPSRERELASAFAQRQTDGLILAPTGDDQSYLAGLGRTPVVFVDRSATGERAVVAVLRGPDPPTAIFAAQNLITIGAVRALRRLGRHRTVALVGFDDFPLADLLDPAVTVVTQDPARLGRTAAAALFERIDGNDGPPREIRIPTTLIPRGSGEIAR